MMEFEDDHEEEEEEEDEEEDSELAITPTFKKHPPQQPPSTTARYRECLKNHAVGIGGHAVDGCGEFMPAGVDGSLDALRCAACNCHRNFHRKEFIFDTNNISTTSSAFNQQLTLYTPRPHTGPPPPHHHHQVYQFYPYNRTTTTGGTGGGSVAAAGVGGGGGYHLHRPLASLPSPTTPVAVGAAPGSGGGVVAPTSGGSLQQHHRGNNHHVEEVGVVMGGGENVVGGGGSGSAMMMMMSSGGSGSGKKRFRTKFTQEQKDKMLCLAEKLGWKIQKQDEEVVQHFCHETGVKRHVLKVWMHNNKHTLGKKP